MFKQLKRKLRRWEEPISAYLYITPSAIIFAIFVFLPAFVGVYYSLTSWGGIGEAKFIGLDNYFEIIKTPIFWKVLKNTIFYTFGVVILQMTIALLLALALNTDRVKLVGFFRTAYFLPVLTSTVAASMIWRWLFSSEGFLGYGLIKMGIDLMGGWLADPRFAMPALILMGTWRWAGYLMVIYLAGLQSIPSHLYEAAKLDGAGPLQRFYYVTWPLLSFTTFFIFVTSIIGSFQVFDQIYIMTSGGPLNSTNTIVYHIYQNAFENFRLGYANALGIITTFLLLLLTVIQFKFRKDDTYFS